MRSSKETTLQAGPYTVLVQRKNIKNLYLRVDPAGGRLRVSAPRFVSDAQIRDFVTRREGWIRQALQRASEKADRPARIYTDADRRAFRAKCMLALWNWEPVVGAHASGFSVREMKTRWGSCNARTGHLNFNLRLLDMPDDCLNYVVVHELCHLWEPNHSKAFWARVEQAFPDWRRVRKELNARQ